MIRSPLCVRARCGSVVRRVGADTIPGFRVIRHSGDFARCRIIAGWLVVLVYRFFTAHSDATNSLIAFPIPTP